MSGDAPQWGIVGSLLVALLGIGRFLLRWEKTFSEAAKDEIVVLRKELAELRAHVAQCEIDNAELRRRIASLEDRGEPA